MGRKHKPWTLSDVVQLFLEQPGRTMTVRELSRAINASRYPDEWNSLRAQIATSVSPLFNIAPDPTDAKSARIVLIDRGY